MPNWKVKNPISHGVLKDQEQGIHETRIYKAGESIDLTKEQAYELRHALENPPHISQVKKMSQEEIDAHNSIIGRPDHMDSGVQLDWKVDPFARQNRSGASIADAEPDRGFGRVNLDDQDKPTPGGAPKASEIKPENQLPNQPESTKQGMVEPPKKQEAPKQEAPPTPKA